MINSTERSDILVFNCYLCHVRFLLTCYVCSTKIGEISDISKCFENFVSQALGVLTRIYAAELRFHNKIIQMTKLPNGNQLPETLLKKHDVCSNDYAPPSKPLILDVWVLKYQKAQGEKTCELYLI